MATSEEIQPHRISLRPRVVLDSLQALMSRQCLCGMARAYSLPIVNEVQIPDQNGELQKFRALIDCGATRIFMSPQLLNRLGLPHEAAYITPHCLEGQVIAHARGNRMTAMTFQFMDHLAQVHEPEVLVISMRAYDLVLGSPWFETRTLEIDWATSWLSPLRTPCRQGEARRSGIIVQRYAGRDDDSNSVRLPDIGGSTPMINSTSQIPVDPNGEPRVSSEDSPTPDIEILGATAFDDLLASDETVNTFALQIGACSGLLGATMRVTTLEGSGEIETINLKRWTSEQGAAAVVTAEEEPHSGVLEWLLPACRVMMGGCWISGVWIVPGQTTWSAGPGISFPIILPNPKSGMEAHVPTPE